MQPNYINMQTQSFERDQNGQSSSLEQQQQQQQLRSKNLKQQTFGMSGLEVIQENEGNSFDNNQHLEFNEKRWIQQDQVQDNFANENYREIYDDGTFEFQQQNQVQNLTTRISQLESDVIKERANNQILRKEMEKKNGNNSLAINQFTNNDAHHQIEQLTLQLHQKDQLIQNLNSQLQFRNEDDVDSDKQSLHSNLYQLNDKITMMEEQLTKIQLENERLNLQLQEKSDIIQIISSRSQEEFERLVNEEMNKHEGQVNKVIQENENLVQLNEKLTLMNQQLDEDLRQLQMKQSDKTEEIRIFWKEHFLKSQQEFLQKSEREQNQLIQQIDSKNQLNLQLQNQLRVNTGYLAEKSQLQSQIDTQVILARNMDTQLKDYQTSMERQRKELFERDRQLLNAQNHVIMVERKLIELQNINNQQNEQLKKLCELEKQTNVVMQENVKLQEIAILKDEQSKLSLQQVETERICKNNIADKLEAKHQEKWLAQLQLHATEQDKLNKINNQLAEEVTTSLVQNDILQQNINSLQQQIAILEEDKDKLLVIVSDKAHLEQELQSLTHRNTDLEMKLTQLLENNKILNQNLNSRINEVNIWVQRYEKSSEENQRLNEKYQKQIQEINRLTEDELRRGKEKQDQNMEIINEQMSKLEEQLNQFQIEKVESENLIRKEQREKLDQLREKNRCLNDDVTHLQKCILELEQKHFLIQSEIKQNHFNDIEALNQQVYEQSLTIEELKRQIQTNQETTSQKQQEEQQDQQQEQGQETTLKKQGENNQTRSQQQSNSNEKTKRQAEPQQQQQQQQQYVQYEGAPMQMIRHNEEGRNRMNPNYQLFDPSQTRQFSHTPQIIPLVVPQHINQQQQLQFQNQQQQQQLQQQQQQQQQQYQQQQQQQQLEQHEYHALQQYGQNQIQYGNNSNGFDSQQQDEASQLKLVIKRLQQENKQLVLTKVADYNNFQDQLRSITNSAYIGRSPQYDFYNRTSQHYN